MISAPPSNVPAPPWASRPQVKSLWVRGYQAVAVPDEAVATAVVFDVGEVRVQVFRGTPTCILVRNVFSAEALFHHELEVRTLPESTYTVLVAPHDEALGERAEGTACAEMDAAEALITVMGSKKLVYRRLFENICDLQGVPKSVVTEAVLNPTHLPDVDLAAAAVARLSRVHVALAKHDPAMKVRVERGLRWLASAHADEGVDRFIKAWTALECIAPEKERAMKAALARSYGMTIAEVGMRFFVGRLHSARSAAVHVGVNLGLNGTVDDYMDALFADILNDVLGLDPAGHAGAVLAKHRASIEASVNLMLGDGATAKC